MLRNRNKPVITEGSARAERFFGRSVTARSELIIGADDSLGPLVKVFVSLRNRRGEAIDTVTEYAETTDAQRAATQQVTRRRRVLSWLSR